MHVQMVIIIMLVHLIVRIACTNMLYYQIDRTTITWFYLFVFFIGINFHEIILPCEKSKNWHPVLITGYMVVNCNYMMVTVNNPNNKNGQVKVI